MRLFKTIEAFFGALRAMTAAAENCFSSVTFLSLF